MTTRVLVVAGLALVIAAAAAYALKPPTGVPEGAPTENDMATDVGASVMEHVYLGHVPQRSGELMLVPKPYNYLIGEWDLSTLGSDTPTLSTSHPNPWSYLTRVPLIFYGSGYAPAGVSVDDPSADIGDLAPTYAELLGMDDFAPAGKPLAEIIDGAKTKPPKVIFTVVIDGGGWNALQQHPDQHPAIDALREQGTTYTNATIGSAPSITGALHATIGTGDYPIDHGIPGNQMRGPDGSNMDAWQQNADPTFLESPTLSDVWDVDNDNRPLVGTVSYEGWHLGMIGHGAQFEGGDKDIAVLWEAEDANEWWVNEDFYTLPSYLQTTDLERLESYEKQLDERDGLEDQSWFGHTLEELQEDLVRPGTPAFVRFTGDAVIKVLEHEAWGKDALTDLMWVEMKQPDYAGHAWNVTSPEEGDVIAETDRQIARYKKWLDDNVGRGNYLLAITADHGQQPLADLNGGWRINNKEIERDIEARFGEGVLEKATPVDVYLDVGELEDQGYTVSDVARYMGTYTISDNIPKDAPGADRVPEARLDERLFAGAFSTDFLTGLTEEDIESFGEGIYPEGDFTVSAYGRG